jgi:hypothetical protein
MGANSYIGNGPNFMVKAIAEEQGVAMPSFGGYMLWSGVDPHPDLRRDDLRLLRVSGHARANEVRSGCFGSAAPRCSCSRS